jgi:hypothetical protein
VAAMFVLFHQRICGPLANSLFHHRPQRTAKPPAKIEAAYHRADDAIQKSICLRHNALERCTRTRHRTRR